MIFLTLSGGFDSYHPFINNDDTGSDRFTIRVMETFVSKLGNYSFPVCIIFITSLLTQKRMLVGIMSISILLNKIVNSRGTIFLINDQKKKNGKFRLS